MNWSIHLSRLAARMTTMACLAGLVFCAGCTTPSNPVQEFESVSPTTELEVPQASELPTATYSAEQLTQGRYMVRLLGCGICHTDGALIGKPDYTFNLAGSQTGIAYSNPMMDKNPGVIYPSNITPDVETGIGNWSESEIIQLLRSGKASHNRNLLAIMPWPTYAWITDSDALAITAYLRSLPPVKHRVPDNVLPGQKARSPYVHFGVYYRGSP
jgi:hypothetical protein